MSNVNAATIITFKRIFFPVLLVALQLSLILIALERTAKKRTLAVF